MLPWRRQFNALEGTNVTLEEINVALEETDVASISIKE